MNSIQNRIVNSALSRMIQEAYRSPPGGKTWLKNVLLSIPVIFAFTAAGVILYVSTITYLGFGISPSIAELGMRVNTGNAYAQQVPWFGTKANNNFICNSTNMGDDR